MYIRTTIGKFASKLKLSMYLSYVKSELIPKLKTNSNLISLRTMVIGEGQAFSVATYESEEDFKKTNKWLGPMLKEASQELDGKFESIAGEVVISYDKPIVND